MNKGLDRKTHKETFYGVKFVCHVDDIMAGQRVMLRNSLTVILFKAKTRPLN
jgi:hypothetical protein